VPVLPDLEASGLGSGFRVRKGEEKYLLHKIKRKKT